MNVLQYSIRVLDADRRLVAVKSCIDCSGHNCHCELAGSKVILTEEEFAQLGETNGN